MPPKKTNNKKIGDFGEQIACKYLQNKGFTIVERNYLKKWGEVDIVARETGNMLEKVQNSAKTHVPHETIHFVEVKTVSHETKADLEAAVSGACAPEGRAWRPEENVTERKLHQIHKAIETWLSEYKYEGDFQIDVIAVRIVPHETYATVKYIENVIS